MRADAESIIGVNLSGESLIAVLADLHLNVLATARRTLPGHAPAPSCASVSLGAAATDERTITDAVFLGWHRVPLAELVKTRLRMPTAVGNDLAAMTLQEAWFGAGREHDRLVLITVGAGIGFGLVVGGEVITTPDAELGLVGGIPVADDGRPATSLSAMDCLTARPSSARGAGRGALRCPRPGSWTWRSGARRPRWRSARPTRAASAA